MSNSLLALSPTCLKNATDLLSPECFKNSSGISYISSALFSFFIAALKSLLIISGQSQSSFFARSSCSLYQHSDYQADFQTLFVKGSGYQPMDFAMDIAWYIVKKSLKTESKLGILEVEFKMADSLPKLQFEHIHLSSYAS